MITTEERRLQEARECNVPWRKWGPYLSERQWGTVREDCGQSGNAWDYFPHDQARSRVYRWGEDGLAGLSDDRQLLCFALALWNGMDPILKERLFGLNNSEGNHGEDVKEYYFYLDSTPTHSYMKYLFKYQHRPYPYEDLVSTNRRRNRLEFEYELLDTGVFDDDRYFDVFVEYAKGTPEFERDFIADKTPHREHKNPYFTLINEVEFCDKVLDEFGVDPKRGLIVNGHVPVKIEKGESPLKHSGKAITIDGAFSEAYGDYGYTLVLEADRTYLALHHQFDSVEAAIRDGVDIIPSVTNVRVFDKPQRTADTGRGAELRTRIELLERLIEAYQNNELHQSSMDGSWPAASLP